MRLPPSIVAAVLIAGCARHTAPPEAPLPSPPLPITIGEIPAAASLPASSLPASVATAPSIADTAIAPAIPAASAAHDDAASPPATRSPAGGDISLAGAPASASPAPSPSARDVGRQALSVFGDSLAAPATAVSADEPTWDMDVRSYETQDRVAHYVSMFSGRGKSHIRESLTKGSRYEAMIRAKFRAGGLPEDMYYLALIESGFNPNAYSRAAAVGMWQFMTSTGRDMGMRIDWWVDERRDPVKSTVAAVRFIRGLRDQFGSLYLAAAAYNGGPGRVARGLAKYSDDLENTQQSEDAFFVLAEKDYLRNETREYVPQLIAAALVAKEPVRYGMTFSPMEPFHYDSVRVAGRTPLAAIATASGTSTTAIRELNPHILRGMTPPGDRMLVRIPAGAATGFDAALSALPKADRVATHTVTSRKGETVDRIAEAHGISSAALESFNGHLRHLKPSGKLVPGQSVVVPSVAVASAATHVPDPAIEKYGSSTHRLRTHTVRAGETVRSVARKYHTTPEHLMKLNGLRKPMIFAGQDLIVAGPSRAGHRPATRAAASSASRRHGKGASGKSARHSSTGHSAHSATGATTRKKSSGASSKAGAR